MLLLERRAGLEEGLRRGLVVVWLEVGTGAVVVVVVVVVLSASGDRLVDLLISCSSISSCAWSFFSLSLAIRLWCRCCQSCSSCSGSRSSVSSRAMTWAAMEVSKVFEARSFSWCVAVAKWAALTRVGFGSWLSLALELALELSSSSRS